MSTIKKLELWLLALGCTAGAVYFVLKVVRSFPAGLGDLVSNRGSLWGPHLDSPLAWAGILCLLLAFAAWWALLSDWRMKRRLDFKSKARSHESRPLP